MRLRAALLAILAATLPTLGASGDELFNDGELKVPDAEKYTIRFEPSLYYASPGGKVLLPGSPGGNNAMHLEDLNLDSPRLSPFGELHVRSGDWRVSVSGFAVSLSDRGSIAPDDRTAGPFPYASGDLLTSSINFASGDIVAAFQMGAPDAISGKRDPAFAVGFETLFGLRFFDVDFEVQTPTGTASGGGFFVQPIVGAKATMSVGHDITIDVQTDLGGFMEGPDKNSLSTNILVGFAYRPTPNVGVQVGYRLFIFDLNDGQEAERFEYRGAVAGLYMGLEVRF